MTCTRHAGLRSLRSVGDPIDVVSGANFYEALDAKLTAPLPFEWWRHYSSARSDQLGPLGWGHTHEYDRSLVFDIDGITYCGPGGDWVMFPIPVQDGETVSGSGLILVRVDTHTYQIKALGQPIMEFVFVDGDTIAPLKRLFRVFEQQQMVFYYHPDGRLKGIVDADQRRIRVDTTDAGLISGLVLLDQDRQLVTYRYDEVGHLLEGIDAYGNSFQFAYDEHHRMISKTDQRGYTFHFAYDEDDRCVRSHGEDGFLNTCLEYRALEKRTIVTQANGGQWRYDYDDNGALTRITDPNGGIQTFALDEQSRVIQETDPNGDATEWVYDDAGGYNGKASSLGWFSDDPDGPTRPDQEQHRVPNQPLQWEYGDLLSAEHITLPSSQLLQSLPQAVYQTFRTASDNNEPKQVYDAAGLLIKQSGIDGSPRRWRYDEVGNTVRYRDHNGAGYDFQYGSWNLRLRETDPLGHSVRYRYTRSGLLSQVRDPGGTVSEYLYDEKDRLRKVRRNGVTEEEYRYDAADNLLEKLDGDGNSLLQFKVGNHNLPVERCLASGETHRFAYTPQGHYASAATDEHKIIFDYDLFENRIQDERDGLGVKHQFTAPGKLLESTILNRFKIRYDQSPSGPLTITDPGGQKQVLRFPGNGLIHRELSNGSAEYAQYDPNGRCLAKVVTGVQHGTWSRRYRYSGEGDLVQVEDSTGENVSYEYDLAHRLRRALYHNGQEESFAYDIAGNLLNQPGLSEVTLGRGNRLCAANGASFEYNVRQSIAARQDQNGPHRYSYDSRDMLVRCEMPEGVFTASYDPLGRRIDKSFNGHRVTFYWDSDRLAAELRDDGQIRVYIYADAFAMTPFMFMEYSDREADPESGQRYFLFSNHLGTPIRVEDECGEMVWQARLEPYGRAHINGNAGIDMPLRFPGHYFDAETGLHYNRLRYYSPELGRYLQPDPLDISGGINLYAYTENPLKQVDLRGDTARCPAGATPPKQQKQGQSGEGGSDSRVAPRRRSRVNPLRRSIKKLSLKMDLDTRERPNLATLQYLSKISKQVIDHDVRKDGNGIYQGWCGKSAEQLLPRMEKLGLGGAVGANLEHQHTVVIGQTKEGKFFMFDPTYEQFTPEGSRFGSDVNQDIIRASNGDDPNAPFMKDIKDNDGLAVFDSREDLEDGMRWYGTKLSENVVDDGFDGPPKLPAERKWDELPREKWHPEEMNKADVDELAHEDDFVAQELEKAGL